MGFGLLRSINNLALHIFDYCNVVLNMCILNSSFISMFHFKVIRQLECVFLVLIWFASHQECLGFPDTGLQNVYPAQSPYVIYCLPSSEPCTFDSECCAGTCQNATCFDGNVPHPSVRVRSEGSSSNRTQIDFIYKELSTRRDVDVTNDEDIHLIPPVTSCGSFNSQRRVRRIVGGREIEGRYPWLVQFVLHNETSGESFYHCGGSLINNQYILTAAHCLTRIEMGLALKVSIPGAPIPLDCQHEASRRCRWPNRIEETIVHQEYCENNLRHDIGLVKLVKPLRFTEQVQPICLPINEEILQGWSNGKMIVAGWGKQNQDDSTKTVFSIAEHEVENTLVSRENCNRFFIRMLGKLRRSQICAGGYPGKGDCQGDSGGPLMKRLVVTDGSKQYEKFFHIGIVSTGSVVPATGQARCGYQGKPSVYTNVIYYIPWILDTMASDSHQKVINRPLLRLSKNVDPKTELATGRKVDVSKHANIELLPSFPNCGNGQSSLPPRVKRVVGGRPAGLGVMPWMVQIYVRNTDTGERLICGSGTLINSRYVLTAAHTVLGIQDPFVMETVTIGNYNQMFNEECIHSECQQAMTLTIEDIIVHDEYTASTAENDIALIQLPKSVSFNKLVSPICLPFSEAILQHIPDRRFLVAGWGTTHQKHQHGEDDLGRTVIKTSATLNAANMALGSRKDCDNVYSRHSSILERNRFCAGGENGIGECTADVGNPLIKSILLQESNRGKNVSRYFQFGITTNTECGEPGMPTIYTNVLYFIPWIVDHITTS